MPDITANLGLKKPLGNETVSRAAYNENLDILDENATKASDLAAHLADNVPHIPYVAAGGAANTYTATLNPAPTAYTEGMALAVKINADNTGASTINVNNLGAKSIKKPNGNDVSAGNLKTGSIYTLRYNGINFILQGSDAAGNATPADVLSGKTFTNDQGDQAGTMPNRGAVIITPSAVDQAILAGYHDGAGKVNAVAFDASKVLTGTTIAGTAGTMINKVGSATVITPGTADQAITQGYYGGDIGDGKVLGDTDLTADNVKSGVNIFGVVGTFTGVKSIQQGTISITGTNPTATATISSITPANSVVLLLGLNNNDGGAYFASGHVKLEITNSTTITATRNYIASSTTNIGYLVIEFQSACVKSKQSGNKVMTGPSATETITSVTTAKSLLVLGGYIFAAPTSADASYMATVVLTNSTTITFSRISSAYNTTVSWQLLEFN